MATPESVVIDEMQTSAAPVPASRPASEGLLINIDNGGTLTDICVIDGQTVYRTKTITTPYDLTRCLFEGLVKVSREVYGNEDLQQLLLDTEYIRYSTTQGTNALVERKGPQLGVILLGQQMTDSVGKEVRSSDLFQSLVGERVISLDQAADSLETEVVQAVNKLTSQGANRLIVAAGGGQSAAAEAMVKSLLLKKFPPQMLGAVPILYAHEVSQDANDLRCLWTALFNAFLHPAMEHFLYNAEHKLRELRSQKPLLIFRNDGNAARVARTIAIKTYSSGPRGGAEGAMALARHYGFDHLVSVDIGGTTTDLAVVDHAQVRIQRRGRVEGIETSFSLCDIDSLGVGGSSIISVENGDIKVGPESAGGEPGPACFGLGGKQATITDAFLVMGLLDPASYFGGELRIDVERARAAIGENVAKPLGIEIDEAAERMEAAWVAKVAAGIRANSDITDQTTLAAFGGAGPFVMCRIAESVGARQVIIPGLAAVFSAYGIGFSDIGHQYEAPLAGLDELDRVKSELANTARRGMFAEGFDIEDCSQEYSLQIADSEGDRSLPADEASTADISPDAQLSLLLRVEREIAHVSMQAQFSGNRVDAGTTSDRSILKAGQRVSVPVYRVEEQTEGASASGPAVLEEAFFTARVDAGWSFEINAAGDILLSLEA